MKTNTKMIDTIIRGNNTIDLASVHQLELDKKLEKRGIIKPLSLYDKIMLYAPKLVISFAVIGVIFVLLIASGLRYGRVQADASVEAVNNLVNDLEDYRFEYYSVDNWQDYERKLRLEACTRIYIEDQEFIDNTYIHISQDPIIRCATMMTIIGAYESDYFNSRRCIEDNNCFGIKDYNTGKFKTYISRYNGYLDFADKYLVGNGNNTFRGHKNRDINSFVKNWSGDDRQTELRYIKFVSGKYWEVYKDLYLLRYGI